MRPLLKRILLTCGVLLAGLPLAHAASKPLKAKMNATEAEEKSALLLVKNCFATTLSVPESKLKSCALNLTKQVDYVALNRVMPQVPHQGEYEKTADFEKRFENLDKAWEGRSLFLIVDGAKFSYDPDKELFSLSLPSMPFYGKEGIYLGDYLMDSKTYVAQNHYGASVDVREYTLFGYFFNDPSVPSLNGDLKISMPIADAKMADKKLAAAIEVRLAVDKSDFTRQRFMSQRSSHSKATFDAPAEFHTTSFILFGTLLRLVVFNTQTGQIVYSSPTSPPVDSPPVAEPREWVFPEVSHQ